MNLWQAGYESNFSLYILFCTLLYFVDVLATVGSCLAQAVSGRLISMEVSVRPQVISCRNWCRQNYTQKMCVPVSALAFVCLCHPVTVHIPSLSNAPSTVWKAKYSLRYFFILYILCANVLYSQKIKTKFTQHYFLFVMRIADMFRSYLLANFRESYTVMLQLTIVPFGSSCCCVYSY
jgi:hypothetical protein